jgi:hypothetical protein
MKSFKKRMENAVDRNRVGLEERRKDLLNVGHDLEKMTKRVDALNIAYATQRRVT